MSQFRVEKRRVAAELTLASGVTRKGHFFLAGSSVAQSGPERVADLLNAERGFVPFDTTGGDVPETVLVNRAHVVFVRLTEPCDDVRRDAGYEVATERHVAVELSNGARLHGAVRVYCPEGRDRLSDYARSTLTFRYLETADATFVVNFDHVVHLTEEPRAAD